jgi:hypothetical protein
MARNARIQIIELVLLVLAAGGYMAWFAQPLLAVGAADARMVEAFFIDEHISLSAIQQALEADTLFLQHRSYGHIFLNLTLLPLFLMNQFAPVSEQQMTIALRLVSAIFGFATIVATFVLARRYFGSLVAWGAAVLLAVLPISFLRYATLARADTTQMFFLVVAVYFGCRFAEDARQKWLLWASAAAGCAFAAKYSGLFLLPVLWMIAAVLVYTGKTPVLSAERVRLFLKITRAGIALAGGLCISGALLFSPAFVARYLTVDGTIEYEADLIILQQLRLLAAGGGVVLLLLAGLPFLWNWLRRHDKVVMPLSSITTQAVRSALVFGIAFALTAPASIWQFDFVRSFVFQSRGKMLGVWFVDERTGFYWIELLASENLLSWLLIGLIMISLGWLVYAATQLRWNVLLHPVGIIWVWVAIHMGLLLVAIRFFAPHFVLPVLPFLLILALHSISVLADGVASRIPQTQRVRLALASSLMLVLVAIELAAAVPEVRAYRQSQITKEQDNRIAVGRWLAEHYPDSTHIVYDMTAYVPAQFHTAEALTIDLAQRAQQDNPPEVVVVSDWIANMYTDSQSADSYHEGPEVFFLLHNYYTVLREEQSGYTLVYEKGPFHVYEHQES